MNKKLILPIVVVVFLFALSPLFAANVSAVSKVNSNVAAPKNPTVGLNLRAMTPAERDKLLSPNANGPLVGVAASARGTNPLGNKDCPAGKTCTVIADGIGGVQVFYKNNIIASVFIPASLSGPYTCPEGAVEISSSNVLVTDPCGNSDAGAGYTFDPYTLSFGAAWTNLGAEPIFGVVDGGNLYITNFGSSSITEVTTADASVGTIATCGFYPEFIIVSGSHIYESNQEGYDSSTGNYAGCIDEISPGSPGSVVATLWGDGTNGPGAYEEFTGIGVTSGGIYVNSPYYYTGYGYGSTFQATSMTTWGTAGALYYYTYNTSPYALWGMNTVGSAVFPISPYNYSFNTYIFNDWGFTYKISGTTVSSTALKAGLEPEFQCTGASGTNVLPDFGGGSSGADIVAVLSSSGTSTAYYGPWYGIVDSYGCGSN